MSKCALKWRLAGRLPREWRNVHTLCAGKPESNDWANNIFVKRLRDVIDVLTGLIKTWFKSVSWLSFFSWFFFWFFFLIFFLPNFILIFLSFYPYFLHSSSSLIFLPIFPNFLTQILFSFSFLLKGGVVEGEINFFFFLVLTITLD